VRRPERQGDLGQLE
jgi:hypothetical protein